TSTYTCVLEQLRANGDAWPLWLYHPITDISIPRDRNEKTAIPDVFDEGLAQGENAYVHCWGGIGRTGTVVGCYLVCRGLSGDEALERVQDCGRRARSTRITHAARKRPISSRTYVSGSGKNDDTGGRPLSRRDGRPGRRRRARTGRRVRSPRHVGGGPFHLRPGEWTDDTSMALCLAESL